ncbi:MAG: hypothetical protein ACLVJB_00675 [Christensenellales bacterium]
MIRLIGFCLLAAVMTMLLRQMNPGVAALLCVAFGAMTLLTLLPAVGEYVTQIQAFLATLALDAVYGQTMLRAWAYVDPVRAQVCQDMDAPSIACRAELCGRLLRWACPANFLADADGGRRAAMKRFSALFFWSC